MSMLETRADMSFLGRSNVDDAVRPRKRLEKNILALNLLEGKERRGRLAETNLYSVLVIVTLQHFLADISKAVKYRQRNILDVECTDALSALAHYCAS